jgi:hypothetical protein
MPGGIVPVSDPICIVLQIILISKLASSLGTITYKEVKLGRDPIESGMVPPRVTANSL